MLRWDFPEIGEGSGQLALGDRDAVHVDVEAGEYGLVEQTPSLLGASGVELITAAEEVQSDLQPLDDETPVGRGFGQAALGILDLDSNCLLPTLELVDRDGISQVGVNKLGLGAFELGQPTALDFRRHPPLSVTVVEGLQDLLPQRLDGGVVELDGAPVPSHSRLDLLLVEVGQLAVGSLLVATQAEEVAVLGAVTPSGVAKAESLLTPAAVDTANEVVALRP